MIIGIDVGGTKIEIAALDERGEFLLRRRVATPAGDYVATVRTIAELVERAESELGPATAVGIGIPGAPSPSTGLVKNANSTALIGKPFQNDVERRLQRAVRVANDANCFVLSETRGGAAQGCSVAFGVILGTGVGGGIAVDARVVTGLNAIAGEWGHNPLPWPADDERPGPQCYCGKRGCIETFLAGPRLSPDARATARAASAGDTEALALFDRYEDRLARALAGVINIVDPDVIVLGGGMSNVERLYANVPALLPRYVFSDEVRTALRPPAFGDSSGVRGAALLCDENLGRQIGA
jgi:fructokinase